MPPRLRVESRRTAGSCDIGARGEQDLKAGFLWRASDADDATMLLHKAERDGETEASGVAFLSDRVKRSEDFFERLVGNAGAVVRDVQ